MPKELLESSDSERKIIKFTKETCCALDYGFEMNPEAVRQIEEIVGEDKVKIFKDILFNSLDPKSRPEMEIRYEPSEDMKDVYLQIAKAELKRMNDESGDNLSCGHLPDQHKKALEDIVSKMEMVKN